MTRFYFALIFVVLANICSAQEEKDWTLLIYVIGSDIVGDAITDVDEMKAAGNTDNINIVGLLGGSANAPGWDVPASSVFIDGEEFSGDLVPADLTTMASSANLTEFINWGISNYPAQRYMIAFYNHGMGVRGFGHDNVSDTQFRLNDLQKGIADSDFIQDGNKFNVIGYDACLMSCLESMSVMKDLGDYYIASEEEEPWHAWNWTPIISAMNSNADLTEPELGQIVVDSFIQHAIDNESKNVTLSMVDLSRITALENSLVSLFDALDDDIYLGSLLAARAKSEDYGNVINDVALSEDIVDIGDLMNNLKDLEPSVTDEINGVLDSLNAAVVYERSDSGKPKASGIGMFVPLNTFANFGDLNFRIDSIYRPISFNQDIQNFISGRYADYGREDNEAVNGNLDDDTFGLTGGGSSSTVLGENFTAIKIPESEDDLHQLQVVLLEEIEGGSPSEFIMLGSSLPDTSTVLADGATVYGYRWDELWLGLNGWPAYISDIQEFTVFDDDDNPLYNFTQLHIPAILNPNSADPTEIVLTYDLFEDGTYLLEEVRGEHSGTAVITPSRENIQLTAGDEVQLVYEIFNTDTGASFFQPNGEAIIQIENSVEDLNLEYDQLEEGNYHVGFVLMDHAHNDTVIYDPQVRVVLPSSLEELAGNIDAIDVYPNPAQNELRLDFLRPLDGATIELVDLNGRVVYSSSLTQEISHTLDIEQLANGTYVLNLKSKGRLLQKSVIIKQ